VNDKLTDRRTTFDTLFLNGADPWEFETSEYERDKRAATIAALGTRRFAHMLEIGCATGVLSLELAGHCDRLTAIDISPRALRTAHDRCGDRPDVHFITGEVPRDWPPGRFDAIVLSEVLYFLSRAEIVEVARLAHECLEPGGAVLLVNWTGENNCAVNGDEAALLFAASATWTFKHRSTASTYRIDMLTR
jgi:predicted TPR repeat methyltransferase